MKNLKFLSFVLGFSVSVFAQNALATTIKIENKTKQELWFHCKAKSFSHSWSQAMSVKPNESYYNNLTNNKLKSGKGNYTCFVSMKSIANEGDAKADLEIDATKNARYIVSGEGKDLKKFRGTLSSN